MSVLLYAITDAHAVRRPRAPASTRARCGPSTHENLRAVVSDSRRHAAHRRGTAVGV